MPDGFFELRTPRDLLRKLKHDYGRLSESPADSYAAFDFIVSANHIPDWLHPKNKKAQNAIRESRADLQVCRELAMGAKHFSLYEGPGSVTKTELIPPAFDASVFDESAFQTETSLVVHLDGSAATTLGAVISVQDLGHKILEYWKSALQPQAER